jgi:hypothetical protein
MQWGYGGVLSTPRWSWWQENVDEHLLGSGDADMLLLYSELKEDRGLMMGIEEVRKIDWYRRIVQFQPREFSAIIGAEICCVRAEFPVRPLPLLFRSLPGLERPPDMKAPAPMSVAGLEYRISGPTTELERRWLDFFRLYRRATKNMAAP